MILVNAEFLPLLEAVKDQFATVKKIVLMSDAPEQPVTALSLDGEYEALLAEADEDYTFPEFDENSVATTFYTTGTTGLPKGVFFSHRQIVLHTYGLVSVLCAYHSQARLDSSDVYMPITPMFHVHAWGMPYLMTLLGAKQVYPGRYEPEMLLKLIVGEKVTFSHCVPTIMHMLVSSPAIKNVDLTGWKVIIGGSALPKGLCLAAMDMGINIYTGYGMSETCPVLTIANLKPPHARLGHRCPGHRPVPDRTSRSQRPAGNRSISTGSRCPMTDAPPGRWWSRRRGSPRGI